MKLPEYSHSHPLAATERNEALRSIQNFIRNAGHEPFSTSGSVRERDPGWHQWHTAADVTTPPQDKPVGEKTVFVSIDDDYYIDPSIVMYYEKPAIFYVFDPQKLHATAPDYNYRLMGDNTFEYRVNGGARYVHRVYDWRADHVIFDYWWGSVACDVETRSMGLNHLLVIVIPTARLPPIIGRFVEGKRVTYRSFVKCTPEGIIGVNEYSLNDKLYTSISLPGSSVGAEIPTEALNTVTALADGKKMGTSTVASFFVKEGVGVVEANFAAAMLPRYAYVKKIPWTPYTTGIRTDYIIHRNDERATPMAPSKKMGRVFAHPFVTNPATTPLINELNSLDSVAGRIEEVINTTIPPNAFYLYADEFSDRLVPEELRGVMIPWTYDEVMAEQHKPQQRQRNEPLKDLLVDRIMVRVKGFIKREPTTNANDPRNISQQNASHTVRLSTYTYPFKHEVLMRQLWYMPGKSPPQVASRIAELGLMKCILTEADGSRFDGRVSSWLTDNVVRRNYLRAVKLQYHKEMQELFDAEKHATAITKEGVPYYIGPSRQSGSPFTTDGNTMITAYIDYCAHRLAGKDADEAWNSLAAYAGDDIVSIAPATWIKEASRKVGMVHDAEQRLPGEPITFLGRVFMNAAVGDVRSLQDPARMYAKLHLTMAEPMYNLQTAMYNRMRGYMSMERFNPIVQAFGGACIRAAQREGHLQTMTETEQWEDLPYYYQQQRLNEEFNGWPQYEDAEENLEMQSRILGVSVEHLQHVIAQYDRVNTMEELMKPPTYYIDNGEFEAKRPATEIVGDEASALLASYAYTQRPVGKPKPNMFPPVKVETTIDQQYHDPKSSRTETILKMLHPTPDETTAPQPTTPDIRPATQAEVRQAQAVRTTVEQADMAENRIREAQRERTRVKSTTGRVNRLQALSRIRRRTAAQQQLRRQQQAGS